MRELPSVLDEREFAWPGIRFSLGHTASREVGGRAEADNDDLVRTHGIDYGPQLLCSFCRCGDEEGLASSPVFGRVALAHAPWSATVAR